METPLLANDKDLTPLSLSSGPEIVEETEFSRLIAQKAPLDAADYAHLLGLPTSSPRILSLLISGPQRSVRSLQTRDPVGILAASTLCTFFVGFIWGSYLADSWSQTHLILQGTWYMPALDILRQDIRLQQTSSLANLLQNLHSRILLLVLWVVALILPCMFMILAPSWIMVDAQRGHVVIIEQRILHESWTRTLLELSIRFSFLVVFVFLLQDLVVSLVELKWTDATIHVRNQQQGGFAAYLVAIVSAVGAILILRSPPTSTKVQVQVSTATPHESTEELRRTIRTPPRHAFQHRSRPERRPSLDPLTADDDDEDQVSMTLLEESPPVTDGDRRPSLRLGASTPELVDEFDLPPQSSSRCSDESRRHPCRVTFYHKIMVFQLGLLTLVLWMPCWYTPFLQVKLQSEWEWEVTERLVWTDIPMHLWKQGMQAGTDTWILVTVMLWMGVSLLILPLLASILGMFVWLGEGSWCIKSRQWLYCIHPALGGVVFSSALLLLSMGDYSNNDLLGSLGDALARWSFCRDGCVNASARLLPGAWFYIAHSLLLEVFVSLSLRWSLL